MKTGYMREYIALAKNLNYSHTANELFMAQPVLSRHIAAIEKELGCRLLNRTKHSVSLTPIGKIVLEEFKVIIKHYDALTAKVCDLSGGFTGMIHIGMSSDAIEEYFTPIANFFKNNYPNIKLPFHSLPPHKMLDKLCKDKLDIGLIFCSDVLDSEAICYHPVGREKIVLMVSDKHPFAALPNVRLEDILCQTIIFSQRVNDFQEYIKTFLIDHNLTLPEFHTIDYGEQIDLLPFLIREENGVAFVPSYMKSIQRKNIVFVDIADYDLSLAVVLAYKADNSNPALPFFLKQINIIFNQSRCTQLVEP
ncbi:LysR family transcriptional regulator [Dehalobacter sp. DCM]|uniref:LysR family transcriptional regulator n=1 Tax=Dehalobacter sp. DCM TaxID=2907827 RepID=UPI00308129D1|nr:LysR family transcriptional regulator [Dehalobacter sp. DCM]